MPRSRLNAICNEQDFDSILLLTSSPLIIDDDKSQFDEHLLAILQLKTLQFPFISVTNSLFLMPTLIPYQLPTIETLASLPNEKIKVK